MFVDVRAALSKPLPQEDSNCAQRDRSHPVISQPRRAIDQPKQHEIATAKVVRKRVDAGNWLTSGDTPRDAFPEDNDESDKEEVKLKVESMLRRRKPYLASLLARRAKTRRDSPR